MVYSGKVSKACQTCRTRRIKCDLGQPACSQCTSSNRNCVYRDSFEVVWRDQNRVAERGVQRRRRRVEQQQAGPSSSSSLQRRRKSSQSPATPPPSPQKIDNVVLDFYVNNQALDPEPGMALTRASILANELATAEPDSALVLAARAITSGLESEDSDTPITYNRQALLKVQQDLNDPVESLTNKTLLAVILLQHYDAMLAFTQQKPPSTTHITGALAVATHRGELNFKDEESRVLALIVRRDLIYNSIHARKPVIREPVLFDHPQLESAERYPSFELDLIVADIHDLTLAAEGFLETPETFAETPEVTSTTLIDAAYNLLSNLDEYFESFPPAWFPVTVSSAFCIPQAVSDAGIWNDQADVYAGIRPCRILNDYRCARLDVLKIILLLQSSSSDDAQASTTTPAASLPDIHRMTQHLVDGICSSVPFNMGSRSLSKPESDLEQVVEYPHLAGEEVSTEHCNLANSIGGYAMIGPLARACQIEETVPLKEGQRSWLAQQLRRVRDIYDIRYPHLFEIRHLVC